MERVLDEKNLTPIIAAKTESATSGLTAWLKVTLERYRLVPVVVIDDAANAKPLGEALVGGGLPVAEVTFRTPAAGEAIVNMRQVEGLLVGAGSVLTPLQVDEAAAAGAKFIVSPGFVPKVVERCWELSLSVMPGVSSASEVQRAWCMGIDLVKFFPAVAAGGVAMLKALAGPFRGVSFVPTGGINAANVKDFLALPQVSAVGGSWMVPRNLIDSGDFEKIKTLVSQSINDLRGVLYV